MNGSELISDANVSAWARVSRSPFPHMSPYDTAVWKAFLEVAPRSIKGALYDVALGGRSSRHVRADDDLLEMWETLIKKRVDVAAEVGGEVWVCEVKPLANMAALGQALTYQYLWNLEGRTKQKARAVVICSRVDEDVEPVFSLYGVLVIVVRVSSADAPSELLKVLGSLQLQAS